MRIFGVCFLFLVGILLLTEVSTSSGKSGRERGKKNKQKQSKTCCPPNRYAQRVSSELHFRTNYDGAEVYQVHKVRDLFFVTEGGKTYYRAFINNATDVGLTIKSGGNSTVYRYRPSQFCYDSDQTESRVNDTCFRDFQGYEKIGGRKYEVYSTPYVLFGVKSPMRQYTRRFHDGCLPEYSVSIYSGSENNDYGTYNMTITHERLEFGADEEALLQLPPFYEPCKDVWPQQFNFTSNSTGY